MRVTLGGHRPQLLSSLLLSAFADGSAVGRNSKGAESSQTHLAIIYPSICL